jgi:hypothetical protein
VRLLDALRGGMQPAPCGPAHAMALPHLPRRPLATDSATAGNDGQTQQSLLVNHSGIDGGSGGWLAPGCGWASALIFAECPPELADLPAADRRRDQRSSGEGHPSWGCPSAVAGAG